MFFSISTNPFTVKPTPPPRLAAGTTPTPAQQTPGSLFTSCFLVYFYFLRKLQKKKAKKGKRKKRKKTENQKRKLKRKTLKDRKKTRFPLKLFFYFSLKYLFLVQRGGPPPPPPKPLPKQTQPKIENQPKETPLGRTSSLLDEIQAGSMKRKKRMETKIKKTKEQRKKEQSEQ